MKVLLYTVIDDIEETGIYKNAWIDENKIDGFYIPSIDDEIRCINLFFTGEVVTVVQNEELVEFLDNKFKVI